MPPDAASSYAVRCLQMLSGASRCCQMIPDVTDDLKCCQMLPAQMPQDARCWLMLPIPTPIPTPMPTQTLIQMPTPTTIPTPIPIQISTYNQEQYPYRFRVLPKGNFYIYTWNLWNGEVGSTSPPGGNQVDGLPPASSTVARSGQLDLQKVSTYL